MCEAHHDYATHLPVATRMACSDLGARLFRVRKEVGLGLIKLGKLCGVSHTAISDIEKGRQLPAVDTVERLARTLKVRPAWLAFGDGSPEVEEVMRKRLPKQNSLDEDTNSEGKL